METTESRKTRLIPSVIKAVVVFLITGFVLLSMFLANFWRLAPEFYSLEHVFPVPLTVQLIALSAFLIFAFLLAFSRNNTATQIGFIATLTLTLSSFYHATLSLNDYSISASIPLVYNTNVMLSTGMTISDRPGKYLFRDADESVTVYTGIFPFGLDQTQINSVITTLGNCTREENGHCREIAVTTP